jgi:hypothetical protein
MMTSNNDNKIQKEKKQIIRTWLAGNCSCTLVIPKEFAKEYGLDKPSHVILQGTPDGILIRKLEI